MVTRPVLWHFLPESTLMAEILCLLSPLLPHFGAFDVMNFGLSCKLTPVF